MVARLRDPFLEHAAGATTSFSASLLGHAFRGEVAEPAAALLRPLTGRGDAREAAENLNRVGHSSGPALAAGVLAGARPQSRGAGNGSRRGATSHLSRFGAADAGQRRRAEDAGRRDRTDRHGYRPQSGTPRRPALRIAAETTPDDMVVAIRATGDDVVARPPWQHSTGRWWYLAVRRAGCWLHPSHTC